MDFDAKFDPPPDRPEPDRQVLTGAIQSLAGPFESLERLSGGYSNLNYKVSTKHGTFVARIAHRRRAEVEAEIALLRHIEGRVPAPRVAGADLQNSALGASLVLLDYLPGVPLSQVEDRLHVNAIYDLGRDIGSILARIHTIKFSACGFFGPDLAIADPMPDYRTGWREFMDTCLQKNTVKSRLGMFQRQKLLRFLEINKAILDDLTPLGRLTHSDFNTKNILVSDESGIWQVTGILDWEFAHSGAPLTDFGNFLRFEAEQPRYRRGFLTGYAEAGGTLPPDWEAKARLLDLAAMLSFLSRDMEQPRTFKTAKAVIKQSVGA